ncbi:MAG: HAD family hydrolase [Gammaproteobacteria bacterium]|nr:MAG: HAD family hydrolase [Gammaproteobacteria bacterium]
MPALNNIESVLFDLDGTLLDTAPDMVDAINILRSELGLDPKPYEHLRNTVSHGGAALIRKGLDIQDEHPEFQNYLDKFLNLYRQNIANKTNYFAGMEQVLTKLEDSNIQWGIVTNKPHWLTSELVGKLNISERTSCIVSGDTLEQRKPHPAPLLHACELLNVDPTKTIYVGDAQRDIEAGNNASMHTFIAMFGYIDEEDHPEQWNADGIINSPVEILDLIDLG